MITVIRETNGKLSMENNIILIPADIWIQAYYLGSKNDGAKKTYWQKIEGYDYYFGKTGEANEGVLRTNTWVENYYVDADGRWDKSKTVVDIKNHLTNYKNLVSKLEMKKTKSWQFGSSDSYVKDGFYLGSIISRFQRMVSNYH